MSRSLDSAADPGREHPDLYRSRAAGQNEPLVCSQREGHLSTGRDPVLSLMATRVGCHPVTAILWVGVGVQFERVFDFDLKSDVWAQTDLCR